MPNIYAAVHWQQSDRSALEEWYPEVLVGVADSDAAAQAMFNDHIREKELGWESYDLEVHLGDGVAQLGLDFPPEF